RRKQARRRAALDEIRGDQAIRESRIIAAVGEIVRHRQLLVRVIAADEPVEPVVEGLALKPKFLAETLELVEGAAVAGAEQDVEIVEIGVLPAGIFIV